MKKICFLLMLSFSITTLSAQSQYEMNNVILTKSI
jgi:hypothetical protein